MSSTSFARRRGQPRHSHLNLQDCRGIGADALRSALPKMPSLRSLVLDGLSEVDDAVVKALAAAPELHEVSLNMCGGVGDEGLEALAAGCPQLEALHLDECKRVTDRGLAAVADGCRGLRALSVRRCAKLSDDVLALVATRGTLQSLCVNAVPSVSSKTMRALALYCRESLTSLDVSFCRRVPEKGLGLVADRCSRLTKLQLFGCSQVGRLFLDGHSNANLTDVLGFGTAASHMRP